MAVTSYLKPLSATSSLGAWVDLANITGSGTGDATSTSTFGNIFLGSYDLSSLPDNAAITGIRVEIKYLNLTEVGTTNIVTSLYKETVSNPSYKAPISYSLGVSSSIQTTQFYGGSDDTWGWGANLTKEELSNLWIGLLFNDNTDNDTIAVNGASTRPSVRIYYNNVKWAKILTSGSALEVTSITASGVDNNSNITGEALFVSPGGIIQSTSSIKRRVISAVDPFYSLTELDTVLDVNYSTYSITVPDLPVSVSFITNSIRNNPTTGIISSAMLFTDITGGLEYSSSYFVEPVLSYEGSQSATNNAQLQFVYEPHNSIPATASLPYQLGGIGTANGEIGIYSDKVSIFSTSSATNYITWNTNRYIQPRRTSPVGMYVTASFSIPFVYNFINDPSNDSVTIHYRYWENESEYDVDSYIDIATLVFSANDLGYVGSFPISGTITGSFILDDNNSAFPFDNEPVFREGGRYALHLTASNDADFQIGYDTGSGDGTAEGTGQGYFKFEIEGQTAGVLDANIILGGVTSGSFLGEQFGNYSGSLSGVVLNSTPLSQAVIRGNGITFNWGAVTTDFWRGARPVTASVILYNQGTGLTGDNKSGLQFDNGFSNPPDVFLENPISLTSSLAGNGLLFGNGGSNISKIDIGTSDGLSTEADGLKINPTVYGDGLEFTNDKISASLSPGLGLRIANNKLRLTESLDGDGLEFPTSGFIKNYSILNIDNTYIVSPTQSLQMKAPGYLGKGLAVGTSTVALSTALSASYSASSGQGEVFYRYWLDGHSSLEGFDNNLVISGSSIDLGNGLTGRSIRFLGNTFTLSSSFFHLNNGLTSATPFKYDRGGIVVSTYNTATSGAVGWFDNTKDSGGNNFSVLFDGRNLSSGSWLLSTASFMNVDYSDVNNTSPWGTLVISATASIDSSSKVGIVSTIITGSTTNPNSLAEHLTFYSTRSISNYGAFYIRTEGTDPAGADSNVWVYITD